MQELRERFLVPFGVVGVMDALIDLGQRNNSRQRKAAGCKLLEALARSRLSVQRVDSPIPCPPGSSSSWFRLQAS